MVRFGLNNRSELARYGGKLQGATLGDVPDRQAVARGCGHCGPCSYFVLCFLQGMQALGRPTQQALDSASENQTNPRNLAFSMS